MKKYRQQQRPKKTSLLSGRSAVIEALNEGKPLERIFLQNNFHNNETELLFNLAAQNKVPVNKVPIEKLKGFNITDHGGCVAVISKIIYSNLQDEISLVAEKGKIPLFLILDGITDIRNIGGIARTAYCSGVDALIIPDKGVGALNEDAILTSAGALEHLHICRVNSLMKAVDELHANGITVIGSDMKAATPVFEADLSIPLAIVMGSEEKGIYPALLKSCDEKIHIPMPGGFESLNVSVATGMILYETMKQRKNFDKTN